MEKGVGMNHTEVIINFSNWLVSVKNLSEDTAKHYVRGINDAGRYNLYSDGTLLTPDIETIQTINLILSNPFFIKDDKTKNQNMSCALKQYAEYLTLLHKKELFEKNKKPPVIPVGAQETRGAVQINLEGEILPHNNDKQPQKILSLLMEQFTQIEQEQRKVVLESYDIEDEQESIRTEQIASSNIRKIRQWKADITRIFSEISEAGFSFELETTNFQRESSQTPVEEIFTEEKPAEIAPQLESSAMDELKVDAGTVEKSSAVPPLEVENRVPLSNVNKKLKPLKFEVFGVPYSVNYWKDLLVEFCEIMLKYKPEIVSNFDQNNELNTSVRINFSYNEVEIGYNRKQLSNKMWIETNRSSKNVKEVCYKILKLCGFNETDLVIYDENTFLNPTGEVTNSQEPMVETQLRAPESPQEVSIVEKPQVVPTPVKVPEKPKEVPVIEESQLAPQTIEVPIKESPEFEVSALETKHTEPQKEEKPSMLQQPNPKGSVTEMYLLGKNYAYDAPVDFFVKVCEMMVLHRPYVVGTFCDSKSLNPDNQVNFSYQESDLGNQGIRLNNGLWVNRNQEESKIRSLCYDVMKICGFSESDLKFISKGG